MTLTANKITINRQGRGALTISTAQLHSTSPELRFCGDSKPARGVSEIRNNENLLQ